MSLKKKAICNEEVKQLSIAAKNMMFIKGRNNLSATVFVPWDCQNRCPFCTAKKEYGKTDIEAVKAALKRIRNSNIEEVVFTGGEPASDPLLLSELIDLVPNKRVYINTTLPQKTAFQFVRMVNDKDNVRGINISRHAVSAKEESLAAVADDSAILVLRKNVRINVVEPNLQDVEKVLERWAKAAEFRDSDYDTTICIREDFTVTEPETLHIINDVYVTALLDIPGIQYLGHSSCNVCDSMFFKYSTPRYQDINVCVHRGLATTSINMGNVIEVNDVVVYPDGKMCYDWDRSCAANKEFYDAFKLKEGKRILPPSNRPKRIPEYKINTCAATFNSEGC